MRRLTDEERVALVPVGPPGEGPVSNDTFVELERLGWGRWEIGSGWLDRLFRRRYWVPTAAGIEALRLDTLVRGA